MKTIILLTTYIGMHNVKLKLSCIIFHDDQSSGSCTVTYKQKEEKTNTVKLISKYILATFRCERAKLPRKN
jgi:hypothetical protein